MAIKYLMNTLDTALPVYEVNYDAMVWRVYAFSRTQYGDEFIYGKIRHPERSFKGKGWKEVAKPGPEYGRRVVI